MACIYSIFNWIILDSSSIPRKCFLGNALKSVDKDLEKSPFCSFHALLTPVTGN